MPTDNSTVHRRAWTGGDGLLLIGGDWVAADDVATLANVNPSTGADICDVALAGAADVDRAVTVATEAFSSWRRTPPAQRGVLLGRLAELIAANRDELAAIEAEDSGKPVRFAANVDLEQVIAYYRYYAGLATKIDGSTLPISVPNTFAYTLREPVGVCALIVPWNFPLLNATFKLAPALAAGCTAILKPAEQTPLTALRLGQLCLDAGFPSGVVNVLTGDGTTGAAMVAHDGVDKVSFTGSTAVGREIGALTGRSLKRVTLELGGKSPNLVLPGADPRAAARNAFMAGYFNTGQVCQAGSRVYVHRSQFDEVLAELAGRATSARLGAADDPKATLGPVVSEEQFDRVWDYINAGVAEGAEVVAGGPGTEVPEPGYFVPPTLFAGAEDDMRIVREEIFGPVLVALPYDDLDEVVRRGNDSSYGLAAYVWASDIGSAHRVAAELKAGSVFVNSPTLADPCAPFGGFRDSGLGREGGTAGIDPYLETKTVWIGLGEEA